MHCEACGGEKKGETSWQKANTNQFIPDSPRYLTCKPDTLEAHLAGTLILGDFVDVANEIPGPFCWCAHSWQNFIGKASQYHRMGCVDLRQQPAGQSPPSRKTPDGILPRGSPECQKEQPAASGAYIEKLRLWDRMLRVTDSL